MTRTGFIKQGLNPFTREPLELFDAGQFIPEPTSSSGIDIEARHGASKRSHFLGAPLLAPGTKWPHGPNGPLTFLLCLDFSELDADVARAAGLPAAGILNVFFDTTGPDWSLSPDGPQYWKLIYETGDVVETFPSSKMAPGVPIVLTQAKVDRPGGQPSHQLSGEATWIQMDQRPWLHFTSRQYQRDPVVVDALRAAGLEPDALATSDHDALLRAARVLDLAGIDPAIFKPGIMQWRLLLQIDSDEDLSFSWGDAGTLYILIPRESLESRSFEDAWICMQCY